MYQTTILNDFNQRMEILILSNCPTEAIIITDPLIFWLLIKQGGPKNNVKFVGFNVDASELYS